MQHKNIAIKKLQAADQEWKSLPPTEKRNPHYKAKLVSVTEEAAMGLHLVRYPSGPQAMLEHSWDERAREDDDRRAS